MVDERGRLEPNSYRKVINSEWDNFNKLIRRRKNTLGQ